MAQNQVGTYPQLPQQEEIPLNRLNSRQETDERQRIFDLFTQYDTDNDNHLNIRELQSMIRNGRCQELPAEVISRILALSDHDGDGRLNFEEFFHLTQNQGWILRNLVNKYCRLVVPPPRREVGDQIDGAYERQMTICPPPLTMVIFSLLEIITFLIDNLSVKDEPHSHRKQGETAILFIYNPYRRYEAWRFITYMFVHVGFMHILMNLIVQIFLGVALELVHHWWRVALVYLAGVAAGSMGTSLTTPRIFLAGASGGVYALITAHIATIIMNWSEMEYAIIQLIVFLIFCFADLGTSIYRHLTDVDDNVGYMAHLSGAVAGLLVGIGVLRNLKVRRWERILWWVAVIFYFALMATGILVHILYPEYFPKQDIKQ